MRAPFNTLSLSSCGCGSTVDQHVDTVDDLKGKGPSQGEGTLIFLKEFRSMYAWDAEGTDTPDDKNIIAPPELADASETSGYAPGRWYRLLGSAYKKDSGDAAVSDPTLEYRDRWIQRTKLEATELIEIDSDQEIVLTGLDVEGTIDVKGGGLLDIRSSNTAHQGRRRFSQENTLKALDAVTIAAGEELVVEEFDVGSGSLDIIGTLATRAAASPVQAATKDSVRKIMSKGERAYIPSGGYKVISQELDVGEGEVDVDGELMVVDLPKIYGIDPTPKRRFFPSSRFTTTDTNWSLTWNGAGAGGGSSLARGAASGTSSALVFIDVDALESNSAGTGSGIRPKGFSVTYEVSNQELVDVVGTMFMVSPAEDDGVGASAVPVVTSLSTSQTFSTAHNTGTKRGAIEKHNTKHTLASSPALTSGEMIAIKVDVDATAKPASDFVLHGVTLYYQEDR